MEKHRFTEQELDFTAVLNSTRGKVVNCLREKGALPKKLVPGGFPTTVKYIGRRRGLDPVLNEVEQQVYETIVREKRLPGGGVIILPSRMLLYSLEDNH